MLLALIICSWQAGAAESHLLRRITVNEGLSQNTVYCLLQDSLGFLWIGTADGLNRYDGYSITVFRHIPRDSNSLPGNSIRRLAQGRDGTLWISTDRGVARFVRGRGTFQRVSSEYGTAIFVDQEGFLWIGTAGYGLLAYNPSTGSTRRYTANDSSPACLSSNAILAIAETPDGTLWLATDNGLDVLRKGREKVEHVHPELTPLLAKTLGASMVATPKGRLWIGSIEGLLSLDPSSSAVVHFRPAAGDSRVIPSDSVFSIYSDREGNVLVGTSGGAAFRAGNGDTFQTIPLVHPWGTRVCLDRSGLIWAGTDGFGVEVHTLRPPKFSLVRFSLDQSRGAGRDFLKSIYEDSRGIVWIGTFGSGITVWDRQRRSSRHLTQETSGLRGKSVFAISGDSAGRVWVGTEEGLNLYDQQTGRFRFFTRPHAGAEGRSLVPDPSCVNTICAEPNGELWIGMNSGFEVFDTRKLQYTNPLVDWKFPSGITSTWTNQIFRDGDSLLWIGTQYAGLLKLDRSTRSIRVFASTPDDSASISSRSVKAIHRDARGRLWIGTDLGLNLLNEVTGTGTKFDERDGFPSSYLYGILEDRRGSLWISSNHGITRFSPDTRSVRNFDRDDGLQSNEFNTGAYFKNSSGEMYFGGVSGLNIFHPDSVRDNPHVPHIVITGFKEFDLPSPIVPDPSDPEGIVLGPGESVFSLQYAGLEFTNPVKNRYAYRLEGFEKNWIFAGTEREVRYTSLPPGSYLFRVKGSNGDGVWNEEGIAIKFRIVPPFWRSWWFVTLCALAIFGVVGGTIRYIEMRRLKQKIARLEQEEVVQRERVRISRDMHDELGASLTRISLLAGIGTAQGQTDEELRTQLRRIEETSREVVQRLDEVVWMVNPKNDTLESLAAYVAEFTEHFFAESPVRCRFDIPTVIPPVPLPADTRRNVFLTLKESLNNVLKHAAAGMVTLQLTLEQDAFRFVVQDNGRGFQTPSEGGLGNGLTNMKKRIEEIKGDFSLASTPGAGTKITLRVPFRLSA